MGVRVSAAHASFEPGYQLGAALRGFLWFARRSRWLRSGMDAMPKSRLRSHIVGRYFKQIYDDLSAGSTRFSIGVHPRASLRLFDIGTWEGPEGWANALQGWLDSFHHPVLEMREWLQGEGSYMVAVGELRDHRGGVVPVRQEFALCVRTADGSAMWGHVFNRKEDALKAAGLRNRPIPKA